MIGYGIPLGGKFLTFQMANELSKTGKSVSIVIDKRSLWNEVPFHSKENGGILDRVVYNVKKYQWSLLYGKFFQTHLSKLYRKIKNIDPSYHDLINSIPTYFVRDFTKTELVCENVVTESALSAFSVAQYCSINDSNGYRLLFHDDTVTQDDPILKKRTFESYSLPLKKIVFNEIELERFKKDKPLLARVWYDSESFKKNDSNKVMDQLSLIMPLRRLESKGARYGIEALRLIHENFPEIKIFTYGDLDFQLVPEFVSHYKNPSKEELVNLLNLTRIFCLPSIYEGFSISTIEAMACGNVPVVTDCGGIHEFVRHEENGLIVPVKDPVSMYMAVKRLLEDPIMVSRLYGKLPDSVAKYNIKSAGRIFVSLFSS
jgi:glycosyltransferase involved in cell wall biosynthesis